MKFFVPEIDRPFNVRGTEIRPDDTPQQYLQKLARITLDEMFQLVGVLTTDGILLECNRAALDGGGLTRDDVIGKPFWETFWWTVTQKTQEDLRNAIRRAAQGESIRYDVEVYARKSGKEVMVMDFTLLPVRDEEGSVVFLLPEGRDITEKKAHEREIARQREELAEIDRAKTAFFSNVSHEFRTPLALMLGPLEEVLPEARERLSPERHEQLVTVRRNALRLLKLVNTLLNFSRIEAGRVHAVYEPTDLGSITSEIAAVFRSAMQNAGLRFSVECHPFAEPVYVDRDMWEQVVLNLLSNAFKFTFEGEVALILKPADGAAELQVRDTGVGIPEKHRERVFERFHRIEGTHARTYEGTGIGLALVQELVKLHGGSVRLESAVGRGSTFTVTIPVGTAHLPAERIQAARSLAPPAVRAEAYAEEAQRWLPDEWRPPVDAAMLPDLTPLPPSPRPEPAEKRELIVVADDNADMRQYLRHLLGDQYKVHAVADGRQALEATRQSRPALVLADIMMPRLDGFGLLGAIRGDTALASTPVILLSARAGEESRVEGLQAGADDYLVKPFTARELVARVETHLKMANLRRETVEREERLRSEAELERQKLRASEERLAETGRLYRELQNREAKIRRLVDANIVGIFIWELEGRILEANDAFLRIVGYDREDLVSGRMRWTELTPPEWLDLDERLQMPELKMSGSLQPFEKEYFRKDGGRVPVLIAVASFAESEKEGVAFVLDLTSRKRAEAAARESEQRHRELEADLARINRAGMMGELAASLAHEIKQPIAGVVTNAGACLRWLAREPPTIERARQALSDIINDANRAARIIDRNRSLYSRETSQQELIDLNEVIREMVALLHDAASRHSISIRSELDPALPTTLADPVQMQQVLMNLMLNGLEAMEEETGELRVTSRRTEDGQLLIAVTDSGIGLPAENHERVFEAFFTTKSRGSGMGLSISRRIIESHGGRLWANANTGKGATFQFTLPDASRRLSRLTARPGRIESGFSRG